MIARPPAALIFPPILTYLALGERGCHGFANDSTQFMDGRASAGQRLEEVGLNREERIDTAVKVFMDLPPTVRRQLAAPICGWWLSICSTCCR